MPEIAERIIEQRDAPTRCCRRSAARPALNLAVAAARKRGVLEKHGVQLIGASLDGDRDAPRTATCSSRRWRRPGLQLPQSGYATTVADAVALGEQLGYPLVIRSSFTLGGQGSGLVHDRRHLREAARIGIAASPNGSILIEECLLGWKEFELEVMRDRARQRASSSCSIENFDPMGVHTGDSHHRRARADAHRPLLPGHARRGAARSSAPSRSRRAAATSSSRCIPRQRRDARHRDEPARLAQLGAGEQGDRVPDRARSRRDARGGLTLDEIPNDITKKTPACFEPTLDYCVVKIPRWAFEKFRGADRRLGTPHEVGGRGDGDRPHLPRGAAQGLARARDAAATCCRSRPALAELEALQSTLREPYAERLRDLFQALAAGERPEALSRAHRHRPLVPAPDAAHHRLSTACSRGARWDEARVVRATPSGSGFSDRAPRRRAAGCLRPRCAGAASLARHPCR